MSGILFLQNLEFSAFIPIGFLGLFALFLLVVGLVSRVDSSFFATMSVLAIILNIPMFFSVNGVKSAFFGLILLDNYSALGSIVLLSSALFFISLSFSNKRVSEYSRFEFYVLYLFMLCGYECMISSTNLVMIFIGLELSSLALYTLIAMRNRKAAIEGAIKYFTMGALSAGFFAFAMAIFYMLGESFDITQIAQNLSAKNYGDDKLLILGSIFFIVSIGFKLSLIPFHTWVGDVYEGASALMSGFISVVPKIAGFVVAIRLFEVLMASGISWLGDTLYIISVLTMSLANIAALVQQDIKRMLAFSSIVHSGFVLGAIVVNNPATNGANLGLFLYWIMFLFANLGAFAILYLSSSHVGTWDTRFEHPYSKFDGLVITAPFLAFAMAIFMLTLAGVPPFGVFWGKMYIMGEAIANGYIFLAVAMAVNSAISVYYYLKLIVHLLLKSPVAPKSAYIKNASNMIVAVLIVSALFCLASPLLLKKIVEFIAFYLGA